MQELVGDLNVALNGIASEQSTHIEKKSDPQANEKLKQAVADLHAAVESCSATQCKRIIDGLERISFAKNQEDLINQLKDQVDDYDFAAAENTIKEIEKTLS